MEYLLLWSGEMYAMKKARIPAIETKGMTGHLVNGRLYKPDLAAVREALPVRYRAMIDRHAALWFDKHRNEAPAHLNLYYADMHHAHRLYLQPLTK